MSQAQPVTPARQYGILALLYYTLLVTALRAIRAPNNFAEVHWLLDYRFGFVKRGFVGELLSLATTPFDIPITAELILVISAIILIIYSGVLLFVLTGILHSAAWSPSAQIMVLAFCASPFVVMSAHLIGYFDNIIIMLGIGSVLLMVRGKPWLAASLQIPALLIHESTLVLIFPGLCLAWLLVNSQQQAEGAPPLSILPILLPLVAFIAIALYQEIAMSDDWVLTFSSYLAQFPFVQSDAHINVPVWIERSFFEYYVQQSPDFADRLAFSEMHGLVLPSTLALLTYLMRAYRVRLLSLEGFMLLAITLLPQVMHLIAWDTPRIWANTIFCAFFALWVYALVFKAGAPGPTSESLSLLALVANVFVLTPLMDGEEDHFSLMTRLIVYTPVLAYAFGLWLTQRGPGWSAWFTFRGNDLISLLRPGKISNR